MELNKQIILQFIRRNRAQIRAFGVEKIGLFGSFVRDEQRPDSDIDLLVEYGIGQASFKNLMHLAFFFEDSLHRKIELVTPSSLSNRLKQYVVQEVEYVTLTD
ncbi:nucleotidyltransferase family protein [Spirosoma foliorum]|uniref:Nucleotidyltransferase family protein n=1 Tax=Spirosoma foliorum TaxID=2710596 RepID=A0A7G5GT72_9BACT|nr:nucleotidyltransferase family protein [Spirosoma foliorum]QMW02064.1 nucleotidyltransferase family protein [Spirosoma foliorum]